MAKVGDVLREARERLSITQAELARRAGLSRSHLCEIEMNRDAPSVRVALALERETGVPADDLNPDVALARAPVTEPRAA